MSLILYHVAICYRIVLARWAAYILMPSEVGAEVLYATARHAAYIPYHMCHDRFTMRPHHSTSAAR